MTSKKDIESILRNALGQLLGTPPHDLDIHKSLGRYGVDSAAAIQLTEQIGRDLGQDLPPTLFYEHETIAAAVRYLSTERANVEE